MAKVTYEGEVHEINLERLPIHEGLAIQKKTGFRGSELGPALKAGDFLAMAGYAWLILHFRMGRDISFEDITEGNIDFDFRDIAIEMDEVDGEADPTAVAEAKTSG